MIKKKIVDLRNIFYTMSYLWCKYPTSVFTYSMAVCPSLKCKMYDDDEL